MGSLLIGSSKNYKLFAREKVQILTNGENLVLLLMMYQ